MCDIVYGKRYNGSTPWRQVGAGTDGFTIDAYSSYLMSMHWVLDGSFNYSRVDNRQRIVILNGDASSNIYLLSLDATGQYALGEDTLARPKLSVTYGHNDTGSYLMQGALLGRRLQVELPGVSVYGVQPHLSHKRRRRGHAVLRDRRTLNVWEVRSTLSHSF